MLQRRTNGEAERVPFARTKGAVPSRNRRSDPMDDVSRMLLFAKVVDHGSISAAARLVRQTPSAVSKQIRQLEDHTRSRLLNRTRHGIAPTAEGWALYEKCAGLVEKFNEAQAFIAGFDGVPRGHLRVASSVAFAKYQLIPRLPDFLARHPALRVSLEATDRDVDIEAEGFDAAIRIASSARSPTSSNGRSCGARACSAPRPSTSTGPAPRPASRTSPTMPASRSRGRASATTG